MENPCLEIPKPEEAPKDRYWVPPIDWLKKHHTQIHFFGLGFIQVKITPDTRFHFYNVKLPSIMPVEEIHNHRYNFTSSILYGELKQEIFEVEQSPHPTHELVESDCKPNSELKVYDSYSATLACVNYYREGSKYWIRHNTFHRVSSNYAITMIQREQPKKTMAHILRPLKTESICPFSKPIPESELWEIVRSML